MRDDVAIIGAGSAGNIFTTRFSEDKDRPWLFRRWAMTAGWFEHTPYAR